MSYEVGSAFLTILPSAKGFGSKLGSEIDGPLKDAGRRGGQSVGDGVAQGGKGSFVAAGKGLGGAFAGAFAAAGVVATVAAVGSYISDAIGSASDLAETVNKSSVIFGQNAGEIEAWAAGAAKSVGLSKQAALEAAAGFGNMFQQLGFAGDVAADMSTDVVQLSADLGSFNNMPTAEVADMISAAFRGEYDSLQRLIPNINAARVEQEALTATGKTSTAELTAQEKAAAVLAIAHKDGAAAAGDFAETSDGLANSQKILQADLENVKSEIGTALLPVALELFTMFKETGVPALQDIAAWFTANKDEVAAFAKGSVDGALMIVQAFLGLMEHMARMQAFWIMVGTNMVQTWLNVVEGVINAAVTMFGWVPGVGDKLREVQSGFGKLRDDADAKFTAVRAAADKTTEGFEAAQRAVQGIRDAVNAVQSKTVTLTVEARGSGLNYTGATYRSGAGTEFRAEGGPVVRGRPYIVGEREAELFVPDTNGHIYNGKQLAAMAGMSSGGGTGTVVQFNGNVGWDANEVARRIDTRQRDSAILAGVGSLATVGV